MKRYRIVERIIIAALCCVVVLGAAVSCGTAEPQPSGGGSGAPSGEPADPKPAGPGTNGEKDETDDPPDAGEGSVQQPEVDASPSQPEAQAGQAEKSAVVFDASAGPDTQDWQPELTEAQKALIDGLPVDDLPTDAVDLSNLQMDQIWRDTLVPLASDPYYDITLYGVVNSDWMAEVRSSGEIMNTDNMDEPLMILRHGSFLTSHACSWNRNAWNSVSPWIAMDDFDRDGKEEAAVCTYSVSGTGTSFHELWIYDLESREIFTPDISNLDISVEAHWEEDRVTLSSGVYSMEVPVDDYITEDMHTITYGLIIDYDYDAGRGPDRCLQCRTALAFGYEGGPYFADVAAPVVFSDGQYKLGPLAGMAYTYDS